MKLVYPAIFIPWKNKNGYTVEILDLPGCISEGHTLAEAIEMGADAYTEKYGNHATRKILTHPAWQTAATQ